MKRVVIFFLLISPSLIAQELKLVKATRQVVNQPVSFSSTTNYAILIKKEKSFRWSVDSLIDVYTQKNISFTIIKSGTSTVESPNHQSISFCKKEKGFFKIEFSVVKLNETGAPATPMNLRVPVSGFTQGVIMYYRAGKKKKQMIIDSFEELETLSVP